MRVHVKLVAFSFCLFFLNYSQCQECLREDMKYENIEIAEKASYADGDTVRVNCMTGYIGLYKLKCEKGEWKTSIGRPCAKKKCSIPGDIANGDFKLTEGTEFAFGAKVVYTCKKGYEMTSRVNHLTCTAQGWDNTLPVCEAVKCPAIHTDGNVTASGNTEKGRYGDVIHFECVSSDKKIDGSNDIHCKETGEWSDIVPTCKEKNCEPPYIPNAEIVGGQKPKYTINSVIEYTCSHGFEPEQPVQITCDSQGQWTEIKQCTAMCTAPYIPNAEIVGGHRPHYRISSIIQYKCSPGFEPKEPVQISCNSQRQWTDIQTCTAMCASPYIPNAEIVGGQRPNYRINSRIQYKCSPGFEPKEPLQISCDFQPQWTNIQTCTAICAPPYIQNAKIVGGQRPNFKINSTIQYKCSPGFEPEEPVQITCGSQQQWTGIQQCTEITCEVPRDQHVYRPSDFFRGDMKLDTKKSYRCESGYSKTAEKATCTRDGWKPDPLCAEITCVLQSTTSGVKQIIPEGKTHFRAGESVEIICSEKGGSSSSKENRKTFRCQENGEWDHKPGCGEIRCEVPRDQNVYLPYDYFRGDLKLGTRRSYYCESGYRQMAAEATCTQDGWTPKPLCAAVPGKCGPPPPVNDGDTADITKKEYNTGERVEYICFNKYKLDTRPPFSNFLTCQQGEWRGKVKCLKPCTVTVEIMNERGIELAYADQQKMFAPHDGHLTYKCQWGKRSVGGGFRKKCNDGEMTLPECV
ncbi:complement factor H isoform X3 [Carassius gibelio]|uniref:complement factor H isoform X3 n=1 Tax=Carassius gibelio TaxID=101364 RepID=UPI002279AC2C|nr:complement factor H isoform X3 [Carassius gibelio]